MDFTDDIDSIFEQSNEQYQEDIWDLPISHSTPATTRVEPSRRPVDLPSLSKHYGLLTFAENQYPIIYRLINDTTYIPYIRFTYVAHIFNHSIYKSALIDLRNLPIVEMTSTESVYYQQLSSSAVVETTDWTKERLLSVSILDAIIAIFTLTRNFDERAAPPGEERCREWRDALERIRQEARQRWVLEETSVRQRIHQQQQQEEQRQQTSACITSNSVAKRRSYFEERLHLSIVDESGGFLQIDAFIYPYVKDRSSNQIYLNFNDLRQHLQSSSLLFDQTMSIGDQYSSLVHAYNVVVEQAQANLMRHGRRNELSKWLPAPDFISDVDNDSEEGRSLLFVPLEAVRCAFEQRHRQHLFIQLFEAASIDEIQAEYKTTLARQFILASKRKGGLVHRNVPCLLNTSEQQLWIPSTTWTRRRMTDDERLFLNLILLYRGWWKQCMSKKKSPWFLKQVTHEQENLHLHILFDNQRTRS